MNNSTGIFIGVTSLVGVATYVVIRMALNKTTEQEELNTLNLPGAVRTSGGAVNNPGNIKKNSDNFVGEVQSPSSVFKSFSSLTYGYRAMIRILRTKYDKDGLHTLQAMINSYAPPKDNNPTETYVNFVAQHSGISPQQDMGQIINDQRVKDVVYNMSLFEQGWQFADNGVSAALQQAYELA